MKILLATSNRHKLEEIRAIFAACTAEEGDAERETLELVSLADLEALPEEPVEDGQTFEENAIKKARHYATVTGMPCLADDSGLEVDALNGEPGVYSARYSGAEGERGEVDLANNRKLLERLEGVETEGRGARFVCAMALVAPPFKETPAWLPEVLVHVIAPSGTGHLVASVRGTVEGRILEASEAADASQPERGRGTNGFGYDPLFYVAEQGKTTAELEPTEKNRISHRGEAARQMYRELQRLGVVQVGVSDC